MGKSEHFLSLSRLRRQIAVAIPVTTLTVHRTVIHSRDIASLTLIRESLGRIRIIRFFDTLEGEAIPASPFYYM